MKITEKHILKTLAGWVVIFIVLSIVLTPSTYNPPNIQLDDALILSLSTIVGLFFLSVVCTGGFGLIIWVPVGYGVGWLIFRIAGWDRVSQKKPVEDAQQPESQSKVSSTREQQALLIYVKKARTKGFTKDEIIFNLINNGWLTDDINWAFDALK